MATSLFACTNCRQRFPLEKLSGTLMQCMSCSGSRIGNGDQSSYSVTNGVGSKSNVLTVCTYCRDDYYSEDSSTICLKCAEKVRTHGKPRACEICNVIAAFIGSKCKRCATSLVKWGTPVTCEQCKQKCAFDRRKLKPNSKNLCWLCTKAYKKVVSKCMKKENEISQATSSSSSNPPKHKLDESKSFPQSKLEGSSLLQKKSKLSSSIKSSESSSDFLLDMNIVQVTQLKEEVESLKRALAAKEKQLFDKERQMTEYKTAQMETEKTHRNKILSMQKQHDAEVSNLHIKIKDLLKQMASSSKAVKRVAVNGGNEGSPLIN